MIVRDVTFNAKGGTCLISTFIYLPLASFLIDYLIDTLEVELSVIMLVLL